MQHSIGLWYAGMDDGSRIGNKGVGFFVFGLCLMVDAKTGTPGASSHPD